MATWSEVSSGEPFAARIGDVSLGDLRATLSTRGVQTNASADALLSSSIWDDVTTETFLAVARTVSELGLIGGGTYPDILRAARAVGLGVCPPTTGVFLRLALRDQPAAPDAMMSKGSAPSGSLTIATDPLFDEGLPRGFYLRVIGGVPWLRGFHCSDEHVWSPGDLLLFRNGNP